MVADEEILDCFAASVVILEIQHLLQVTSCWFKNLGQVFGHQFVPLPRCLQRSDGHGDRLLMDAPQKRAVCVWENLEEFLNANNDEGAPQF